MLNHRRNKSKQVKIQKSLHAGCIVILQRKQKKKMKRKLFNFYIIFKINTCTFEIHFLSSSFFSAKNYYLMFELCKCRYDFFDCFREPEKKKYSSITQHTRNL